ncbi:MAG TPA: proteasome accessory factor PafA2 family protein [Fimbriimonadaceae bacterium]|nr:proteasome accessory factor PafA2 family protein [Fimbriimonadaceae bacterium]HRJ32143.1 proteasome accessory factor PafA2 family protein [Fimbriimonadaceae bacterium]
MSRMPHERIFGVETEFGCLVADDEVGTPEQVVERIKDHLFYEMKIGAIDRHARDEVFEPPLSGGFLINGGRMYIDAVGSHLEYATAECRSLKDLVANDRAGQRLIVRALHELGLSDSVSVYNNSVDHFGGHTFGCHENFLAKVDEDFFARTITQFYPFLVTRQIFAGVGRVGGHQLYAENAGPSYEDVSRNPIDYIWVSQVYGVRPDDSVEFQLSQRADHILKTVASRVRFNRALINPKWEHFYSHEAMQRLHLLFGESNPNEHAYALKIGTSLLVLRLLEDRLVPEDLKLAQPLIALREISRDPTYQWPVVMADGSKSSALEVQRRYLELCQPYREESEQNAWIWDEWSSILDGLEKDPLSLGDRVDWVAKKLMVEQYRDSEGLSAQDDALHSIDLEYHNIDPGKGLYYALSEMGQTRRFVSDLDILDAAIEPPSDTRAKGRAALVAQVIARKGNKPYLFDWNAVALDRYQVVDLSDPFETYEGATGDRPTHSPER